MKVSELDVGKLVDAISSAIYPVVFDGVDGSAPPKDIRERAMVHSEVMGRIMGVLLCGDEVGHEVFDLIDRSVLHMKASHAETFGELLGPGGSLSKIHKT